MAAPHGVQLACGGDKVSNDLLDSSPTASSALPRKVGRPRMRADATQPEDATERRRRQVRLAQRAYRSRHMANMEALKAHLAHLQAGIQDISHAAVALSDQMMQAGVLAAHAEITSPLCAMLHKCTRLAKEVEPEWNPPFLAAALAPSSYLQAFPPHLGGQHRLYGPGHRPDVPAPDCREVGMSSFTHHLRLACLLNELALLRSSATTMDDLRRPFRLLLSLVPRETIISIFEASLSAWLHGQEPERPQELSVFQQDTLGSRYKRRSAQSQLQQSQRGDGAARTPPHHSQFRACQTGGEQWLDVEQLAEYLREKNVSLCLSSPSAREPGLAPCLTSVLTLIRELVNKAICLGHSPGFESRDVEAALQLSTTTFGADE
ncbi:hypothetical protein BO86DRAFT_414404 [Aspergillus japonicus CBS 114.51]|uniref:BZIP domain-containing protein n=1 Tax=Aspergillus japonicus CBS 114.51 TaxID=1448312 RepID=A0A8T8WJS1_ASPJA|nr:hypothetical protein BO86DRAFT_414404 [Aspergillus japonicus CBS 114.51]RAH75739.1 hypothetical protein BO86DRAFT_414404 [Aspergillus japonicus CBS 114.51]